MKTFMCACLCGLSITASAQMKYSDTKLGVSFEYPRGYVLKEGTLDKRKDIGLGYLGPIPMEFAAPGGVRVATIEAPTGSYPGTDFVNAFFTVTVNPYLTNAECKQFSDDRAVAPREEPVKEISGVEFHGVRISDAGLGHQFSGVYFHGFSEVSCYEIAYGMATAGYGAVDGMKPVDSAGVFSILKNVLGTVTVHLPRPGGTANSPSIEAFGIAPLGSPNTYQVSWNVERVEAEQVWLSASCFGNLTILKSTGTDTKNSVFPCDVLCPAKSTQGSFDLKFRNMAGEEIKETIRLFAAGQQPVSKTLTISLPPLQDSRKQTQLR